MHIYCIYNIFCSWYSDEATIYKVRGSNPSGGGAKYLCLFKTSRPAQAPIQPSVKWVLGFFLGGKVGEV